MSSVKNDVIASPTKCNFIVMSNSGKPIFARYGSEEEIARVCGLLSAIRTSVAYSRTLNLGEIQSLRSGSLMVVFFVVDSIVLVAISAVGDTGETETLACLRLQLEYLFALIIFTMTEQVQAIFQQNASFDLRTILGATEGLMRAIVDDAGPEGNPGPYLLGGAPTVFPLSPETRYSASQVLCTVGNHTNDTVFALLIADGKLVTVVQPAFRAHQLRTSDMHLLLCFLGRHQGIYSSELWLPVCLPRFNSSGFLYCYTHCLDVETKLVVALISQNGTTEQFQILRDAATIIRRKLSFPVVVGSVLTILDTETSFESSHRTESDVQWSRSTSGEDDYVDASGDGDKMIPYVAGANEKYVKHENCLLKELKFSVDAANVDDTFKEYLDIAQAIHFIFRFDALIHSKGRHARGSKSGHLTQCINAPLVAPFDEVASKRRLWSMYQKLNLRLRLGSASVESTMDAFSMISQDNLDSKDVIAPGIGKHCPGVGLVESPPNNEGLSYIMDETHIFMAINGSGFEL
jgi:hypothetical protein